MPSPASSLTFGGCQFGQVREIKFNLAHAVLPNVTSIRVILFKISFPLIIYSTKADPL